MQMIGPFLNEVKNQIDQFNQRISITHKDINQLKQPYNIKLNENKNDNNKLLNNQNYINNNQRQNLLNNNQNINFNNRQNITNQQQNNNQNKQIMNFQQQQNSNCNNNNIINNFQQFNQQQFINNQ